MNEERRERMRTAATGNQEASVLPDSNMRKHLLKKQKNPASWRLQVVIFIETYNKMFLWSSRL